MTRLYCGNVSSKAELKELKEMFAECGKLKLFDIRDGSGYIVNKRTNNRNTKSQKMPTKRLEK